MADYDQIMQALRNAHAAGDTAAAQRLAQMARAAKQSKQAADRIAAAKAGTLQMQPGSAEAAANADAIALAQMQPAPSLVGDLLKTAPSAFSRGVTSLLDLPGMAVTGAGGLMTSGLEKTGIISPEVGGVMRETFASMPTGSGSMFREGLGAVPGGASEYKPQTTPGEYLGTAMEFLPGAMAGGFPGMAGRALLGVSSGLASEAAGQATEGTAIEPYARLIGALAGGLTYQGVSGLVNATRRNKAIRQFIDQTPDVAAIKSQAGDLYDAARAQGAIATPAQVDTIADDLMQTLRGEGLITPKGNMAGSYPRVSDAIKLVDDYRGAQMTPTEMLQVRKSFQAAAQSADPVEARIGTILIRQFDDFTSPLAPQIAEANQIYRRAMQGDLIETTIELAGSRSGQFSGSGFENALRTEFRGLERKVIKGQLKVTPDEEALIKRIAQGGFSENLARDIGKAAPRGVVSTGISSGVPFAVGTSIGGPALGAALAATTLGAGEIGRRVATSLQSRNASLLSALARSGGQLPANIGAVPAVPSLVGTIPGLLAQ